MYPRNPILDMLDALSLGDILPPARAIDLLGMKGGPGPGLGPSPSPSRSCSPSRSHSHSCSRSYRSPPHCLPSSCTLYECLKLLASRGFLSVPVFDADSPRQEIRGTVDVLDIIAFYSSTFSRVHFLDTTASFTLTSMLTPSGCSIATPGRSHSLEPILENDWMEAEIGQIINFSGKNEQLFIEESARVSEISMLLAGGVNHRGIVLSKSRSEITEASSKPSLSNAVAIVSQSDVLFFIGDLLRLSLGLPSASERLRCRTERAMIKLLRRKKRHDDDDDDDASRHRHHDRRTLRQVAGTPLRDLGIGTSLFEKEIISVQHSMPMLSALKVFIANSVSTVAVVNESGELVGSLTGSDLKGLEPESFLSLTVSVEEFLIERSPSSLQPEIIERSDTLMTALDKLMQPRHFRLRHLWIVDKQNHPVGICSQTDLMRICTTYRFPQERRKSLILGCLAVTVLRARNIKPSKRRLPRSTYVAINFPGRKVLKTPVVAKTDTPIFLNQTFHFEVLTDHIGNGKMLLISLFSKRTFLYDRDLGTIPLDLSWIANRFGKGASAAPESNYQHTIKKWLPLHINGQHDSELLGELLVRMVYRPLGRPLPA